MLEIIGAILVIALLLFVGAYAAALAVGLVVLSLLAVVGYAVGRTLYMPLAVALGVGLLFIAGWSIPLMIFEVGLAVGTWARGRQQLA